MHVRRHLGRLLRKRPGRRRLLIFGLITAVVLGAVLPVLTLSGDRKPAVATPPAGQAPRDERQAGVSATGAPPTAGGERHALADDASDTPTPTPQATLEEANRHLLDGELGEAITRYQGIAERFAGQPEGAEADFLLARTLYGDGQYAAALVTIDDFLRRYPNDARKAQALFLRAMTKSAARAWPQTINAFQDYLAVDTTLGHYAWYQMAVAHERLGDLGAANGEYERAAANNPPGLVGAQALERLAALSLERNQLADALAAYERILPIARKPAYLAGTEYKVADLLLKLGRNDEAKAHLLHIAAAYPEQSDALRAVDRLNEADLGGAEPYHAGIVLLRNGRYADAAASLARYLTRSPAGEWASDARYNRARALWAADQGSEAIAELSTLLEQAPRSREAGDGALLRARYQWLMGEKDVAAASYRDISASHAATGLGDRALLELGESLEGDGQWDAALETYADLARRFPGSSLAAEGILRSGLIHSRNGNTAEALRLWQAIGQNYPTSSSASEAQFWLGKELLAEGKPDDARQYFALSARQSTPSYYADRARAYLKGLGASAAASGPAPTAGAARSGQADSSPSSMADDAPVGLPPALATEPHFRRGTMLVAIGLRDDAIWEMKEAAFALGRDATALTALADFLARNDLFSLSISVAEKALTASGKSLMTSPRRLQELLYPTDFSHLVEPTAARVELDPLLLYSLIRQESMFDPTARSSANAYGLTQIIPSTADSIADSLGRQGFQIEDLYKPPVAVEFGAWFFAQAMKDSDQNVFVALAGYNAGPGRAKQWFAASGGDIDRFVENIPFDETREYVKIIYENYSAYREIYGK